MNLYLSITIAVLAAPLALSFDKRVAYYTHWRQLFLSMIPVSTLYIVWDILVTERGDWAFEAEYAGSIRIFGLPLGEWMFFIVVPYACIFILEVARAYFPDREYKNQKMIRYVGITAVGIFLALAVLFKDLDYTMLALLSVAVWIGVALIATPWIFGQIHTLWYFFLSIVAFLLVNGVLTYLPIVTYNPEAIWGVRIVSIPLEDLFYNIGMLGLFLVSYEACGRYLMRREH
jgi:lycopene cyclase domain-containing protein